MGAIVISNPAEHCLIEDNLVHHIIAGGRKPAIGIHLRKVRHVTVQHNTVFDIVGHTESMGVKCDEAANVMIRRNLAFLCDKEGIRLITQDTDTENTIEANIAIHNHV
jgi:hypothetical protein